MIKTNNIIYQNYLNNKMFKWICFFSKYCYYQKYKLIVIYINNWKSISNK